MVNVAVSVRIVQFWYSFWIWLRDFLVVTGLSTSIFNWLIWVLVDLGDFEVELESLEGECLIYFRFLVYYFSVNIIIWWDCSFGKDNRNKRMVLGQKEVPVSVLLHISTHAFKLTSISKLGCKIRTGVIESCRTYWISSLYVCIPCTTDGI